MTFHLMYDIPVSLLYSQGNKHCCKTAPNHQCQSLSHFTSPFSFFHDSASCLLHSSSWKTKVGDKKETSKYVTIQLAMLMEIRLLPPPVRYSMVSYA